MAAADPCQNIILLQRVPKAQLRTCQQEQFKFHQCKASNALPWQCGVEREQFGPDACAPQSREGIGIMPGGLVYDRLVFRRLAMFRFESPKAAKLSLLFPRVSNRPSRNLPCASAMSTKTQALPFPTCDSSALHIVEKHHAAPAGSRFGCASCAQMPRWTHPKHKKGCPFESLVHSRAQYLTHVAFSTPK